MNEHGSLVDAQSSSSRAQARNNNYKLRWLTLCHEILFVMAVWYCYQVFVGAAEACYVLPCYQGPGLQALWKVNKGVTFTGESSGVFALVHATVGYWLVTRYPTAHAFVVGILAGCTLCASLLSLNMIWVWGAEWNLLGDMTLLSPNNAVFDESGRHMTVNRPLIGVFQRLFYLSVVMCLMQSLILMQLLVNGSTWIRLFRLRHAEGRNAADGSVDEMTPLQSA